MNIKRFQTASKVISIILKFVAVIMFAIILLAVFFINLYNLNVDFMSTIENPILHIFSYTGENLVYNSIVNSSIQIVSVFEIAILSYVYWKGGQLFKGLSLGEKPFTEKFAESIKSISIILIVSDLVFPLILSLLITLRLTGGYYFMFNFTSMSLFGLILYVLSGIFFYGIELQMLADDTV